MNMKEYNNDVLTDVISKMAIDLMPVVAEELGDSTADNITEVYREFRKQVELGVVEKLTYDTIEYLLKFICEGIVKGVEEPNTEDDLIKAGMWHLIAGAIQELDTDIDYSCPKDVNSQNETDKDIEQ